MRIRALIIGLSSLLPILILQYEAKTGLGANIAANRALLEQRIRFNQTNQSNGVTNEPAVKANINALDLYKGALDAAKKLSQAR